MVPYNMGLGAFWDIPSPTLPLHNDHFLRWVFERGEGGMVGGLLTGSIVENLFPADFWLVAGWFGLCFCFLIGVGGRRGLIMTDHSVYMCFGNGLILSYSIIASE